MNKLIIPIIVVAIIAVGIGAFSILQKSAFPDDKPSSEKITTSGTKKETSKLITKDFIPFEIGFFGVQDEKEIAAATPMDFTRLTNADWVEIETKKGEYNWWIDNLIKGIKAVGTSKKVIIVLRPGYIKNNWPPLMGSDEKYQKSYPVNPDNYNDWRNFLTTLFKRYSDNADMLYWQIGNEFANPHFWGGSFEQYMELAKIAYEVKEQINPKIKLISSGLVIPQEMGRYYLYNESDFGPGKKRLFEFQDKLLNKENARYFDIIDVHFFSYLRYNPFYIEDSVKGLRKKMRDEGYVKPIASMESTSAFFLDFNKKYEGTVLEGSHFVLNGICSLDCGGKKYTRGTGWGEYFKWVEKNCSYEKCSSGNTEYDKMVTLFEAEQAKDFTKMFVMAAEQRVSPLIHVQFSDFMKIWDDPYWNYHGVLRRDPFTRKFIAKKPVYCTYLLLYSKIKKFDSALKIGNGQYKFMVNGKPVFVLWSESGQKKVDLSKYFSENKAKITRIVTELDKYNQPIYSTAETVSADSIVIDETPVFVESNQPFNSKCGDRVCNKGENEKNCKEDCSVSAVIRVDASTDLGQLPYLFRSGMFSSTFRPYGTWPSEYGFNRFLEEHKPGLMRIGSPKALSHSKDLSSYMVELKSDTKTTENYKKIIKNGGEVLVSIGGTPKWLLDSKKQKDPSWGSYPPSDYNKWADIVYEVVNYYNNKEGLDLTYSIANEPDISWYGTEEELFKLYKYSVIGALRADPNVKIGGMEFGNWKGKIQKDGIVQDNSQDDYLIRNFIEYSSKTPLPEFGLKRLPLNFVSYHIYNTNPFSTGELSGYNYGAKNIRKWLSDFGYDNTYMAINEWADCSYEICSTRDTEQLASYAIAGIYDMDKAGIKKHTFTTLISHPINAENKGDIKGDVPNFGGYPGIFTHNDVIKPEYNVFRMLSMMEGKRISVESDTEFITSIASNDGKKVYLLVSSYAPTGPISDSMAILRSYLYDFLREHNDPQKELEKYGMTVEDVIDYCRSKRALPKLPADLMKITEELCVKYKKIAGYARNPQNIQISVNNLPFPITKYERYIVDAKHSNSCGFNKETANDKTAKCGTGGILDNKLEQINTDAENQGRETAKNILLKKGYTEKQVATFISTWDCAKKSGVKSCVPEFPKSSKERIIADATEAYKAYRESRDNIFYKRVDKEINTMEGVALEKVEEKQINALNSFTETIIVQPYSVNLIVLSKELDTSLNLLTENNGSVSIFTKTQDYKTKK